MGWWEEGVGGVQDPFMRDPLLPLFLLLENAVFSLYFFHTIEYIFGVNTIGGTTFFYQ